MNSKIEDLLRATRRETIMLTILTMRRTQASKNSLLLNDLKRMAAEIFGEDHPQLSQMAIRINLAMGRRNGWIIELMCSLQKEDGQKLLQWVDVQNQETKRRLEMEA